MDDARHIILRLPENIKECGDFHEGFAPVGVKVSSSEGKHQSKLGYIDKSGNIVIAPVYDMPTTTFGENASGSTTISRL